MPASTYAGNKMLDLILRGVAFTPPTRVWVSLHTEDPGPTGLNEVAAVQWPSYARQDPAQGAAIATGFAAAASKSAKNAKQMLFGSMDGSGDLTIKYSAVWDALTGGNMLDYGLLTPQRTLSPGDECVIKPDKLTHTVL